MMGWAIQGSLKDTSVILNNLKGTINWDFFTILIPVIHFFLCEILLGKCVFSGHISSK